MITITGWQKRDCISNSNKRVKNTAERQRMSTVYIVILTYIKPLEEIDAAIPAHVEWLKKGYAEGIFLASGRRVPRNGGVILAKCESLASLEERLRKDPFQRLKLATADIIPFEPSMKTERLANVF